MVKYLTSPGLDIHRAFGFVSDEVLKSTGDKQEPFVCGSLGGEEIPLVPAKTATPAAPEIPVSDPKADERRDYEFAMQLEKEAWEAFLARHAEGFYANLARLQLEKLAAE